MRVSVIEEERRVCDFHGRVMDYEELDVSPADTPIKRGKVIDNRLLGSYLGR